MLWSRCAAQATWQLRCETRPGLCKALLHLLQCSGVLQSTFESLQQEHSKFIARFLNVWVKASEDWGAGLDVIPAGLQQQCMQVPGNLIIFLLVEFGHGQLILGVGGTLSVAVLGNQELILCTTAPGACRERQRGASGQRPTAGSPGTGAHGAGGRGSVPAPACPHDCFRCCTPPG